MSSSPDVHRPWLDEREGEHLECKEAKSNYHFEKLLKYCAALANEGGGKFILGVTDKRPRRVVGTRAFSEPQHTVAQLTDRLRLKIEYQEIRQPEGRVLIFEIPSRPTGMAIEVNGAYFMRAGDELRPMTPDQLRRILNETGPDFSAEVCSQATLEDLDPHSIERFRSLWRRKSGNAAFEALSPEQLLSDAEMLLNGGLTYAALILSGTRSALGKFLGQAEVIFEYRASEAEIAYQQREEFRQGFIGILDDLWELINLRNETQSYQEGLFRWDIPTFNEAVVREAILNAVTHRDYRLAGSVMIRQFPRKLEIVSPGGFPPGVTAENILWCQVPRNRRIAEACARCGLVERSGQGADRMFREMIREGKQKPDYTRSDSGVRYILSRKFYSFLGRRGVYARRRGLDRETNKALLLRHIEDHQGQGAPLQDLKQVLPDLSHAQIQTLLRELKREGRVHVVGTRRIGRWYAGSG